MIPHHVTNVSDVDTKISGSKQVEAKYPYCCLSAFPHNGNKLSKHRLNIQDAMELSQKIKMYLLNLYSIFGFLSCIFPFEPSVKHVGNLYKLSHPWNIPKWHGPWRPAATAAAGTHWQRWRSLRWYTLMAAIHGGSLEIRATKPLITLWAFNPPAAASQWNATSLLQLSPSGEAEEQATRDRGREVEAHRKQSHLCCLSVIIISSM